MVTIKCSVYEKYGFLRLLDYAKEKKWEDYTQDKMTYKMLELDLKELERLRERVMGKVKEDYQQSSWSYSRNHGDLKERERDDLPSAPFIRTDYDI